MKIKTLVILIFLISSATTNSFIAQTNKNISTPLKFVVLSDIHIYTSGKIPKLAPKVINHVKELSPDLVLITGDHTNGNRGDGASITKVRMWYKSIDKLLAPLTNAQIPIIPIVGNHDFYQKNHKKGYLEWSNKILSKSLPILNVDVPDNPLFFNFTFKKNEFFIFNLWQQVIEKNQLNWINKTEQIGADINHRFGFGHVPLRSSMGKTSKYFFKQSSELFNKIDLDIYFCGHEHLHWDEENSLFPNLRQVIVGTSSGTYNFPIRPDLVNLHCHNSSICEMPYTKSLFKITKTSRGAGLQKNKQNWLLVKVHNNNIQTQSYTINKKGDVTSFFIED
jgi:predicted phosphodiesterase